MTMRPNNHALAAGVMLFVAMAVFAVLMILTH